jgi:hypothetical protein
MGKRQRYEYPAFQSFSASRSQKQEKARRVVDDKTLLSPAGHDPRDHLFSLPRRQRPRGRIFAVLLAPLVDDSTRTTGCTSRRAENVTTNRCYETLRALGRSQGGTEGGTRAPVHHDARTKPCDALDLGGVAAEQPTLEAMRASGRCWPRRGCSREISLPSGATRATRATAAASRHGPDNDRGPCSADLKPQMWPAPSQLPAIRCFCGDGFAAA